MFRIEKRMEIAGAHQLHLPYKSKCSNVHGHNWVVFVYCQAEKLNENGMVVDFTEIKRKIHDQLDHSCLSNIDCPHCGNNVIKGTMQKNPTAENLAKWICDQIPECYEVTVQESEGNIATYIASGAFND